MTRRGLTVAVALVALALLAAACNGGATDAREMTAVFPRTVNLFVGSDVRVLGLPVGQVTDIQPDGEHVTVTMVVDGDQPLPADATAHLTPTSLVGERFVQIEPVYTDGPELEDGAVIPADRTTVPTDVDEVLLSFEDFLAGLEPEALAELVDSVAATLEGQGAGLNELIGGAAGTVRILSDASHDLSAIVAELADLNETLATRDDRIGPVLEDFSAVLNLLREEKPHIIEGLDNLQRLTLELRPLLEEHNDPLVRDLEVLATTLATVDRNLERIGNLAVQGRRLFAGFGGATEYETARLPLVNQTEELEENIQERLRERLAGVCVRLGFEECADPEFFAEHMQALRCTDDDPTCRAQRADLGAALTAAIRALPAEVQQQLDAEARHRLEEERRRQEQDEAASQPAEPQPDANEGRTPRRSLPDPDPRLAPDDDRDGVFERLFGDTP